MKVSVCMATHEGSRYVGEQIASILPQLAPWDELVICDDASTDGTFELISGLADSRIRLIRNEERVGFVKSFERAISAATGDVIFLSDQDDVWHPDKLQRVLRVFDEFPAVAMVHHARRLMDADGRPRGEGPDLEPGVRRGFRFLLGEAVKASVWGCALAMRADRRRALLPFPQAVYTHDHWAAIIGSLQGGIYFLPERLVSHRQHAMNVSPRHGLAPARRVGVRLRFLLLVLIARRRVRRQSS